jgi:AcrR family transcriptional regulator
VAQPPRAQDSKKPRKSASDRPDKLGRTRGRPPVISTERLLDVAREVFLELGIRATTSEVAARAGIAEGTIFHRFKSKEELFRAAMNFDPDAALVLAQELAGRVGERDLRETLVEFAERFMELGRVAMPVMMMSWSNPENMCAADRTSERATRYRKVINWIAGFVEHEMQSGRLRAVEPEVMARMFIGSLHHYCMIELFVGAGSERFTHRQFAEHVVDVLLGCANEPADAAVTRPSTKAGL